MIGQQGMFGVQAKRATKQGIIYETSGRAREYRELACNLYSGCDHACRYCYAPTVLKRKFEQFICSAPRQDILRKLRLDAQAWAAEGETRQILLCFTCDPYQRTDVSHEITRQAIQICHSFGLAVCVLTKGGARALRDLDLLTPRDAFASTLTTLDAQQSGYWEPGGAPPDDRIETLRRFHERGIPTWVSLEPVLDPAETLEIIRRTHAFVDEFKVGVLNYHALAKTIDWRRFAHEARDLLESLGCRYYLKEDLRKYL